MNYRVPKDFVEVTLEEFNQVLGLCNWLRDGWHNADVYRYAYNGEPFAVHDLDQNRWFVAPELR